MSTPQYPTEPQGQGNQNPDYPTQPGYPQQPNYPPQPNYPQPAYPSQPLYPQYGEQQPGFGYGAPPSQYPGQYPGQPPYGGPPYGGPPPQRPNRLPLILGIVAAIVLLCVVLPGVLFLFGALRGLSNVGQAVRNVQATETAAATLDTATATAVGPLTIYENPMDGSQKDWLDNPAECTFKPDGYHIVSSYICYAPPEDVTNFTVTVTAKQLTGVTNEAYGLIFRRASMGNYYGFGIDGNGKWIFTATKNSKTTNVVDFTANPAIQGGLGVANTLQVTAIGSHFVFAINGTQVGQADDTTFSSGRLGLSGDDNIDVVYTNFKATQASA